MIITPFQLWKGYDRKEQPLNSSVISKSLKDGYTVKYVYFNGEVMECGTTRIYGKLYEPSGIKPTTTDENQPQLAFTDAVLVLDEVENGVECFDPSEFLSQGMAVLVVDYAGETENSPRYTMYPKSVAFANYFLNEKGYLKEAPSDVKQSSRYVWSTVALRSVTFLEELGYKQIAMLGIGDGGHQVFPTAYMSDTLKCAAVQFSGQLVKEPLKDAEEIGNSEADNSFIAYKAALAEAAYAPFLKVPVFFQLTSNEQNSSFDEMNSIFNACNDMAVMAISELSDKTINEAQKRNTSLFFRRCFDGGKLPKSPKLTAKASEKSLYFNILAFEQDKNDVEAEGKSNTLLKAYCQDDIERVKLFVAHCQRISAYRNWNKHTIENVGEGEYLAKVAVFAANEPLYSFVNVKYNDGFEVSSPMLALTPAIWGIEPVPFQPKRRIYDSDMGMGEWVVIGSPNSSSSSMEGSLELIEGALGIMGVTAKNTNRMATFVLADKRYVGAEDAHLQLSICSPLDQTLTFSITSSNGFSKYSCEKQILANDNWLKLTLSPSDFRSKEGNFDAWNKVIIFEISGESEFLVNSLLWV